MADDASSMFFSPARLALFSLLILSSTAPTTAGSSSSSCKCLPSDSCWPDASTWAKFNASIDGQLLASKPPAWPCYQPNFDGAACKTVTSKWSDPFWRASQAGAMQDPFFEMEGDNKCLLTSSSAAGSPASSTAASPSASTASSTCSQGRVPVFAVRVTSPTHVQKAVKFAAKHNLRLVIKNTGHDYLGRSSGAGALSLWMHNLQNISFVDSFVPQGCSNDFPAQAGVVTGAGVLWEDLYKAVHEHGRTIAGPQCTSVGASGGYSQAAGHSPMSPTFGLSADNVLELQVVTAAGMLVTANACQNKDLFWALRGGGGGTFGVVLSTTHATHPPLRGLMMASFSVAANRTSGLKTFLTEFAGATPALSDAGWGGFMVVLEKALIIQYLLPNATNTSAASSFQPLIAAAAKIPGVAMSGGMQSFPSYYDWHKAVQCGASGCTFQTGEAQLLTSRLIPRSSFTTQAAKLASALIEIKSQGYDRLLVYLTAGGKVSTAPKQENAVNPAWRSALWHVIVAKLFDGSQSTAASKVMASSITATGNLLRNITSGSGCYLNEADYNEPDWKQSFFGSNYDRLKAIKKSVDPQGLFACRHCVGSEDWDENLVCRAKSA